MTVTVKGKMDVRFPANITMENFLTVTRSNGTYTFNVDYSLLTSAPIIDPATAMIAVMDQAAGIYKIVSLTSLILGSTVVQTLSGAGPYTALPADEVLIIKQTVAAPFTVNVDWSARSKPLRVVDGKGDANINNITITPAAGQTQMGSLNYSYIIDGAGGTITLTPLPDNTGAY